MFLQLCNIFFTHLKINNKYLPNYGSAGGPCSGLFCIFYCTFLYVLVDLSCLEGGGSSEPKDPAPPTALYLGNCTPQARWNLHPCPWPISHGESGETGRSMWHTPQISN